MNKFSRVLLAGMIATGGFFVASANAATIINGSFEQGTGAAVFAGSNAITGWTVNSNYVDRSFAGAADGSWSIDLAGGRNSSISQAIDTIIGQAYEITFSMAGNLDNGLQTHTMIASVAGSFGQTYSFTPEANANRFNKGWVTHTYAFTATSNSSLLTFAATDIPNDAYGPMIDKVSIAAVPEPASWAMLIAGFGMVGGAVRRSRTSSRAVLA